MILVLGVWTYLRALLTGPTAVALENVALRHQPVILQRSLPSPRLRRRDRILWVCRSRFWTNCAPAWSFSALPRSSPGTVEDSSSTGAGGPDAGYPAVRRPSPRSARSFTVWPARPT
jgi:hypothetical protein